jgi:hypothetical protein
MKAKNNGVSGQILRKREVGIEETKKKKKKKQKTSLWTFAIISCPHGLAEVTITHEYHPVQ